MPKFSMRLDANDEYKIKLLKARYGFTQTSDLIRYILTNTLERVKQEEEIRNWKL